MTDPVAIALIGGLPLTLAALAGLITVLKTQGDTKVILGHVNSEKTAGEGREAAKDKEIALLREMIADMKSSSSLLAQDAATRQRFVRAVVPAAAPVVAVAAISPEAQTTLAAIESNTAQTVEALKDKSST